MRDVSSLPKRVTQSLLGQKGGVADVGLNFGEHPDVVFERAPLTAVVGQARFSPILSLLTEAGATGFQSILRGEYPLFEKALQTNLAVSDTGFQVEKRAPVFRFASQDGIWRVSLAVDFVALETPGYTHFGEFLERMTVVLDAAKRTLVPGPSLRIGLRKVNELHPPAGTAPHSWRNIVNPVLLGAVGYDSFPTAPDFAVSDLRFSDQDNVLVVRHGLRPDAPGTYFIDQDYFTERPYEVDPAPDLLDVLKHF